MSVKYSRFHTYARASEDVRTYPGHEGPWLAARIGMAVDLQRWEAEWEVLIVSNCVHL